MKNKVSPEVEIQAMKIAKGRQTVGQTKEQTKLIAHGIQKGIAEYKKQHGIKIRKIDKQRKQTLRQRESESSDPLEHVSTEIRTQSLPWILLALSWLGFVAYIVWQAK
jgi:hypothetical protein